MRRPYSEDTKLHLVAIAVILLGHSEAVIETEPTHSVNREAETLMQTPKTWALQKSFKDSILRKGVVCENQPPRNIPVIRWNTLNTVFHN